MQKFSDLKKIIVAMSVLSNAEVSLKDCLFVILCIGDFMPSCESLLIEWSQLQVPSRQVFQNYDKIVFQFRKRSYF